MSKPRICAACTAERKRRGFTGTDRLLWTCRGCGRQVCGHFSKSKGTLENPNDRVATCTACALAPPPRKVL